MKIKSVNVTPAGSPKTSKWLEYRVGDLTIAESHTFMCNGRFNAGRLGRSFCWYHENLRQLFGEKYTPEIFNYKSPGLVYGTGGTLSLKKVKEIINSIA